MGVETQKMVQARELIKRNPLIIGKLITFEGFMKGNKRAGVQRESDVVVDVRHGKRGEVFCTARGMKVPWMLVVDIADPAPDQIPRVDVFAQQAQKRYKMGELVGRRITWRSERTGESLSGTAVRVGKSRLTVMVSPLQGWRVPPKLITHVDGEPFTFQA